MKSNSESQSSDSDDHSISKEDIAILKKFLARIRLFLHEHPLPKPSLRITRKFRLSHRSRPEVAITVHWQSSQSTSQTQKNKSFEFEKAKTSPQYQPSKTLINAGAFQARQWPSTLEI